MDAGRTTHGFRPLTDYVQRALGAFQRSAGDNHALHAGGLGAVHHGSAVLVEAVMAEVEANIDEAERGARRYRRGHGRGVGSGSVRRVHGRAVYPFQRLS